MQSAISHGNWAVEYGSNVTSLPQHAALYANICWQAGWNNTEARFEQCFLPVINAAPAIVALLCILLWSVSQVAPWRPRWTRPFVAEQTISEGDNDFEPLRLRRTMFSMILLALACFGAAIQLAHSILRWPFQQALLTAAAWILLASLLLIQRPRTVPVAALAIHTSLAFSATVGITQPLSSDNIAHALNSTTFGLTVLSLLVILCMPLRDPQLPNKDISAPGTTPTSSLRSPEDNLALWQWMTVSWMNPLIAIGRGRRVEEDDKGQKRQLEDEDVWQLGIEFQHKWLHEYFRVLKGTVVQRLLFANGLDLVILVLLGILETTADFASPVLLQRLLASMSDRDAPVIATVRYAAYMLLVKFISTQSAVFSMWFGRRCYERSRGEMITMLYEKTLNRKISFQPSKPDDKTNGNRENGLTATGEASRQTPSLLARCRSFFSSLRKRSLVPREKEPASMGKILNLMRSDVYEVAQRFWEFQTLVTTPINIIFSAVLVVQFLGPTALSAIILVLIAQAINLGLARVLVLLEKRRRKATDDKLQIVSQFVEAIRHLRWYGWQDAWLTHILDARQHELNWRIVTSLWNILITLINSVSLEVAPAVGFWAYTVIGGGRLTVDIGFPALQLMFMLTMSLRNVPQLITTLLNAWVAVDRIEGFMAEPDKDESKSDQITGQLALRNASCAWPGCPDAVLINVGMSFGPGLTVICGEVAAGKTALLQALLGELDILAGSISRPNAPIGYCSQTPWLQSMSIRENILFSAQYNEKRYQDVVHACALTPDLAELSAGDLSFIGENGIGLSGGQKARVALARAAYSESKILLLDDPLSALDQQTAESIVHNLFEGALFRDRTVVLVTHRLDLVTHSAYQMFEIRDRQAVKLDQQEQSDSRIVQTTSVGSAQMDKKVEVGLAAPTKFIEDEHRAQGGIKASVYWEFIKAGKLYWWALLLATLTAYRLVTVFYNWFIKDWGEAYSEQSTIHLLAMPIDGIVTTTSSSLTDGLPPPDEDVMPWLRIVLFIGLARSLADCLQLGTMLIITYVAGKRMFQDIMRSVGHATFRFYDVTPVGRLMNRMTSDVGVIDGNISYQFNNITWLLISWSASIVIIALVTPTFLVFAIVLIAVFVWIFVKYLPASQSLRRLEMVSLTPLMSNFGELLNGLTTVRAFAAQARFQDRVIRVVDSFQKMDHFYWSLQTWLRYRYDTLSAVATFVLTMLALATKVSPGLTAFVLLAAQKFIRATHSLCKEYGQLQMEFVSVERIVELLHLDQEPTGAVEPPAWWPSFSGDIIFKDVQIKYAPHLEPALSGVSFTIKAGSKTAILGRTGSGKSTLALALLATILPEQGQIIIDNIDLAQVNKQILRTRVTFLAQDPVLFPGTMAQNLDPLEQHARDECEAVLARVCGRQGWTLDTHIEGGGRNLSQGQRQLVGLARAVLRRSAIIILDEATASIDLETSMQIQQVLHEEMKESTVITIAHRLEAVSNADYCIVLAKGKVLRQGPASELLASDAAKEEGE